VGKKVEYNGLVALEGKPLANRTNGKTHDGWRDEKGRFVKGNPGGPGNPYSRQVAELKRALFDAVTYEDIKRLAKALLKQALNGNVNASKLLLSYLLGVPKMEFEIRSVDAILQEEEENPLGLPTPQEMAKLLRCLPPEYKDPLFEILGVKSKAKCEDEPSDA